MAISLELLDALLSPAAATAIGQQSPREQAEAHLATMTVPDRASGLLSLLLELPQAPEHLSRRMMASVLLRSNIASLSTGNLTLLKEMIEPLLSLFCSNESPTQCRRQIGHCLAEICASLSILSAGDSDEAINVILTRISAPIRNYCKRDLDCFFLFCLDSILIAFGCIFCFLTKIFFLIYLLHCGSGIPFLVHRIGRRISSSCHQCGGSCTPTPVEEWRGSKSPFAVPSCHSC